MRVAWWAVALEKYEWMHVTDSEGEGGSEEEQPHSDCGTAY